MVERNWDDTDIEDNDVIPTSQWIAHVNDQKGHSGRHESGGADEISVQGLNGQLAEAQNADSYKGNDIDSNGDGSVNDADGVDGTSLTITEYTDTALSGESFSNVILSAGYNVLYSLSIESKPQPTSSFVEMVEVEDPQSQSGSVFYYSYEILNNSSGESAVSLNVNNTTPVDVDITVGIIYS